MPAADARVLALRSRRAEGAAAMSRHITHMPPLLPLYAPKPPEKKNRLRRKPGIFSSDAAAAPAPADTPGAPAPATASGPASHPGQPIDGSTGALGVLLTAQEEAQPADAPTRREGDDEEG
jgi:hypothetical protein